MKKFIVILALILTIPVGTTALAADLVRALKAYDQGDYATAIYEWEPLAKKGIAEAQFFLGVLYKDGKGFPRDEELAVKWFKLAAEQGIARAQYYLGEAYKNGRGIKQDYGLALKWYRLANEQGDLFAKDGLKFLKKDLVYQGVDKCLFEEISKITSPETKTIIENYCRRKVEAQSLEWLVAYGNFKSAKQ